MLKVLIACEESQAITIAMRKRGVECYSCDIQDQSGGHPEWHIMGDVLPLLNGNCSFKTQDGVPHMIIGSWDLIIAHPPCTYLTVSANKYYNVETYGIKALERLEQRKAAIDFFMAFTKTSAKHWAIENPVGIISTHWRKPDMIIQPYFFGDPYRKTTCFWVHDLPKLQPTKMVDIHLEKHGKKMYDSWHMATWGMKPDERRRARSKTYPGIAEAIADQWINYIKEEQS